MVRICLICLLLAGCANYQHYQTCKAQIGPQPDRWADAFGLIGAGIAATDPDRRAWDHQMDICMGRT